MRVVDAARVVLDAIADAAATEHPLEAAEAFRALSETTMASGESVLDLLAFEDMQTELAAP